MMHVSFALQFLLLAVLAGLGLFFNFVAGVVHGVCVRQSNSIVGLFEDILSVRCCWFYFMGDIRNSAHLIYLIRYSQIFVRGRVLGPVGKYTSVAVFESRR